MHDTRERIVHIFNALIAGAPAGSFPNQVRFVADDKTAKAGRTEKRAMASADGETVFIVRALCDASDARMTGVLAHELAHVSLLQRGKEDHTEREADALAKSFWGHTIRYDEEDVQTIGPGTSPRPAHLDSRGSTRKSTRTRRNPQYDRLAWKIAVGASQRMTSGRVDAHDALVEEWKPYEDQDLHRELFRHARDILGKHSVDQLYAGLAARKSTLDDDIEEQAERAAWQEAHEEGRTRYNPSEAALSKPCPTCGALVGDPCRQVGPGGGQGGRPQSAEKLGIAMVSIHAARKRAAWQEAHEEGRARYNPLTNPSHTVPEFDLDDPDVVVVSECGHGVRRNPAYSSSDEWMSETQVRLEVLRCLKKYNVDPTNVSVGFSGRLKMGVRGMKHGYCAYNIRTGATQLTFSKEAWRLISPEDRLNTIRHEAAHAICFAQGKGAPDRAEDREQGHGPKWRAIAIALGSSGERRPSEAATAATKHLRTAAVERAVDKRKKKAGYSGATRADFTVGQSVRVVVRGSDFYGTIEKMDDERALVDAGMAGSVQAPYALINRTDVQASRHAARNPRQDVRGILKDPEQRRRMMTGVIRATQAREGIDTTQEQAEVAYDAAQRRVWKRGDVMKIGKTQWILQRAEPGAASFWAYKWPSKKNKSYAILCFDDVCTVHEIGGSAQRISADIVSGPPVFVEHLKEGSW